MQKNPLDLYKEVVNCALRFAINAYSKPMKRNIRIVVHYPVSGGYKIYFSTDITMSAKDIIEYYRTRFQIEFCFRDAKQFNGPNHCQARDLRKLDFAFNASLVAVNVAKVVRTIHYSELSRIDNLYCGVKLVIITLCHILFNELIFDLRAKCVVYCSGAV